MDVRPIGSRSDHAAALREIDALVDLVEAYEARTWPVRLGARAIWRASRSLPSTVRLMASRMASQP